MIILKEYNILYALLNTFVYVVTHWFCDRKSHPPTGDLRQIPDGLSKVDTQSTILEPLTFSVQVIRNISAPTTAFPNVDVQLQLNHVKVCHVYAYTV